MMSAREPDRAGEALRVAFHEAARGVRPSAETARVIAARHRRRRRRQAVVASVLAVAVVVAGVVTLPRVVTNASPAVLQPSPPDAPVLDAVDGVTVTWLPPGIHRVQLLAQFLNSRPSSNSRVPPAVELRYGTGRTRSPAPGDPQDDAPPLYTIGFSRDKTLLNLTQERGRIESGFADEKYGPHSVGSMKVRGLPALRVVDAPSYGASTPTYGIVWNENGVALSVSTMGGSPAQLAHFAAGLEVGTAADPADAPAARRSVEAAMRQALTGTSPDAALAAVDGDDTLRTLMNKALTTSPEQVHSVRLEKIDSLSFLGPIDAVAQVEILQLQNEAGRLRYSTFETSVDVTLTSTGWKVQRKSFCDVMFSVNLKCAQL